MIVLHFNLPGLVIVAIAFGTAFGVGEWTGLVEEGPFDMIAGPLVIALDGCYRWKSRVGHWFHPGRGGSLLGLPVWLFGLLWLVLGIVRTMNDNPC